MIRACVIGYPVKHSRSPLIHGHWLKEFGIVGSYERMEVAPEALAEFLATLSDKGLAGCNITLPHKETAAKLISKVDDIAKEAGSVNTVFVRDGALHATSTDGYGFVENLTWRAPDLEIKGLNVLMLGAGGSARAIVASLLRAGAARIVIANRTVARAAELAAHFGAKVHPVSLDEIDTGLKDHGLVINTTSAGIADANRLTVPFAAMRRDAIITDINYVPRQTPFLKDAAAHNLRTVDGLGMLLHQAVPGFELWFGQRPRVSETLYRMVARDIDPEDS